MNGLALIRAIDWRTSASRSSKASAVAGFAVGTCILYERVDGAHGRLLGSDSGAETIRNEARRARGNQPSARASSAPLPGGGRDSSRVGPLLVRRNVLADNPEEPVSPAVPEKLEPLPEILHRRLEIVVRPEVALEAPVLLVELEHCLGVRDGRLDLAAAAYHAVIGEQLVDGPRRHARHAIGIEAVERLPNRVPLGVDDASGETRREGDLAEH